MLTSHSRTLAISVCLTRLTFLSRHLATKRVLPPTAIRTRSPHTPPTPPASLVSEVNSSLLVNPRSARHQRRNNKMADLYVVPDDSEEDAELALAIQMSLLQPAGAVAESSSSSAKRKADTIIISDTESELEEVPPPSRKVKVRKESTPTGVYKPPSARRKVEGAASVLQSTFKKMEDAASIPQSTLKKMEDAASIPQSTFKKMGDAAWVPQSTLGKMEDSASIPQSTFKKMGDAAWVTQSTLGKMEDAKAMPERSQGLIPPLPSIAPSVSWQTRPGSSSILGIDRGQMERERLERLHRNKLRELDRPTKIKLGYIMPSLVAGKLNREIEPIRVGVKPSAYYQPIINRVECGPYKPDTSKDNVGKTYFAPGMKFPQGVVKKTWVKEVPRDGTDITFEEVLQKETVYGAVLSAYQWDHEWLWTKIPDKKLQRFVLVMQAKQPKDKEAILHVLGDLPKTTIVFPPMSKANCMHSKLMLLFHRKLETGENWLRIAVPTANLTDYDWGERGNMENSVFIIDLPKLPTPNLDQTPFQKNLTVFCTAQGIPEDILTRLPEYDFSATATLAFISSIGGEHYGDIINDIGYTGLGRTITALGYNCGRGLEVDFVTSSLGATDKDFVMNMYRAAMGCDGMADLARRAELPRPLTRKQLKKMPKPKKKGPQKQKGAKGKNKLAQMKDDSEEEEEEETDSDVGTEYDEETSWARISSLFRLYFPSRDTVVTSVGGIMSAGTICFTEEWWGLESYPHRVMRDCTSVRDGVLMHNKMLFARPSKQLDTPAGKLDAWAYIGSANFSESAWGKLVYDGKKIPRLKCKNWECGVIVPVFAKPSHTLSEKTRERVTPLGIEVFNGVVPVPMHVPSVSMRGEGRIPWYFKEMGQKAAAERRKMKR